MNEAWKEEYVFPWKRINNKKRIRKQWFGIRKCFTGFLEKQADKMLS